MYSKLFSILILSVQLLECVSVKLLSCTPSRRQVICLINICHISNSVFNIIVNCAKYKFPETVKKKSPQVFAFCEFVH